MVNTRRRSYKEGEEPAEGPGGPARSTRARTVSITSDSESETEGARVGTRRRRASSDSATSASPSRTSERTPRKSLLARYRTEEKAAGVLPPVTEETKEEEGLSVVVDEGRDEKSDCVVLVAGDVAATEDNDSSKKEKASEDAAAVVKATTREDEILNSTVDVPASAGSPNGNETRTDTANADVTGAEVAEGYSGEGPKPEDANMKTADPESADVEMSDRTVASDDCDVEMPEAIPERTEGNSTKLIESDEVCTEPQVKTTAVDVNSPPSNTEETAAVALSDKKLADIQKILGTSPVQTNLAADSTTHHSSKPAPTNTFTRVQCPPVPRGKPKSGRFWKPVHTKMERTIVRKRDSYDVRMKKSQQLKVVKDLERQMKAEHKEKMEDLRKRKDYNTKKAAENALKAEVYQVLKNPNKIKRMKKKQLRQLTTRDTTVVGKSVLDD